MKCFYEQGLKFSCTQCSGCCGGTPGVVYLSQRDLTELATFFSLCEKEFIDKYCRWIVYYGGAEVLSLQNKKNNDCILWDKGCSAYPARPIQCSTYPFWDWMLHDKETWDDCAKDCKGMNNGKIWTKEEIEEQVILYKKNAPLEREAFEKSLQN